MRRLTPRKTRRGAIREIFDMMSNVSELALTNLAPDEQHFVTDDILNKQTMEATPRIEMLSGQFVEFV